MIITNMAQGETGEFTWDYSGRSDILNIHRKNKLSAGNAELGDFTVDFDSYGNIIGLEIMNAADFMAQINLESSLEKLQGVELITKQGEGSQVMYIWLKLTLPQAIEHIIPIPAPVMA